MKLWRVLCLALPFAFGTGISPTLAQTDSAADQQTTEQPAADQAATDTAPSGPSTSTPPSDAATAQRPAEAVPAFTGPALRVVRGASSQVISVSTNRAVVLEAAVPFAEVSVANPGIADVAALSNSTIYILGKSPGRTTLTLLGQNGRLIANVDLRVAPDVAEFKERLAEILPGEPIEVRTAANGLVLSGVVSGGAKLSKALELANKYAPGRVSNMMYVGGTQQVMLKVRIAEVQRSAGKDLGIGFSGSAGNAGDKVSSEFGFGSTTFSPSSQGAGGQLGISIGPFGSFSIDVLIDALESKGRARLLAEPNIVALSGDTGSFLAGGEVPIPVAGENQAVTIEYKPFGVGLSFVPTVIDDNLINLKLVTEVSDIGDATFTDPTTGQVSYTFSTNRTETTVELRDGQSFAIGGLLKDNFRDSASQVPWLGDLPVLGALFRSNGFQRNQTELVVIVTAYLVTATSDEALALPTDRFRIPTERDLFLLGKLEGSAELRNVAGKAFEGSYGYVME